VRPALAAAAQQWGSALLPSGYSGRQPITARRRLPSVASPRSTAKPGRRRSQAFPYLMTVMASCAPKNDTR
jgi:hypothetical protein